MTEPIKPYELTFEERLHYLYAHIKADTVTEEMATEYLRKIAGRCGEVHCTRLLLHRDIPAMPIGMTFFIAKDFQAIIDGTRIAIVDPRAANHGEIDFVVTVANNRGGNFHAFTNDADAEAWLLRS